MSLESEFTLALEGTITAAKKRGYVPTIFMQMLAEHGAVETARRLLSTSEPQTGLYQLWELGLLHESMEAVIWDNPRFHTFFESTEIDEAHRRLEELGYFKKGK
jgi:hypothetical protein